MIMRSRHRPARHAQVRFDDPFGTGDGISGVIFGASGGVMEAALRTVIELVTAASRWKTCTSTPTSSRCAGSKGCKYVELPLPDVGPVPELIC
jgi:iron only hydrogenase large subunit-like protein